MNIKNFLSILMLLFATDMVAQNIKPECTGKVAKVRPQVFVDAEKREEALEQVLVSCCPVFRQAIQDVTASIIELDNHMRILNQNNDGTCKSCEKNETKDLQKRLNALLQGAHRTLSTLVDCTHQ